MTASFLLSWQCAVSNQAQKSQLQPPGFPPRGLFWGWSREWLAALGAQSAVFTWASPVRLASASLG